MRKRILFPVATLAALLIIAGAAVAANLRVQASTFNPGGEDVTLASARVRGLGNPLGTTDTFGWILAGNETVAFPPGASADLTVRGFGKSITVESAGFDFLAGSYCQGGSPRINLENSEGDVVFLDCDSGTITDLGNGWMRVTFDLSADPVEDVVFIQLLHDEGPGAAVIDNITINDQVIEN
jgi:hypothetical protein